MLEKVSPASPFLPIVICLSLALAFWHQVQSGTIGHVVSLALPSYGRKHGIEAAVLKASWRNINGFKPDCRDSSEINQCPLLIFDKARRGIKL